LLDGVGALITTSMLLVILDLLNNYFGMPVEALVWLIIIAGCFAAYSFSCYLFLKRDWWTFLKIIAIANASYCAITSVILILFWNELTLLGMAYFIGEIILVLVLVRLEWMKANSVTQRDKQIKIET